MLSNIPQIVEDLYFQQVIIPDERTGRTTSGATRR